ncbi:MAG TPA: LLM class flavin-dependent oxidoreductase [Jatrophihabitantaceae bacterium]|nr:LLM class flavin-dependent oxidoreductase [Jatrophihabitantaceae bacterium]
MSKAVTTSVIYPLQPVSAAPVVAMARLLHRRGTGRLWMGQSLSLETQQLFAYLAGMGLGVPFGAGVSLMPLRHPYDAAMSARSLASLSDATYVAGIGPSAPEFQRALLDGGYPRPVTSAREYAMIMRRLLDGDTVSYRGQQLCINTELVAHEAPAVEVGLGVLRIPMATAAGAVADVAITWLTPPEYIRDALLPAATAAAAERGKPAPRIATVVHVAIDRPGRDLRRVALLGAGVHLSTAHYTDMLRQAGIRVHCDDPRAGAQALLDAGVYLTGTPRQIATHLREYQRHGVNEVILNAAGVLLGEGTGAALTDLALILDAVDDLDKSASAETAAEVKP